MIEACGSLDLTCSAFSHSSEYANSNYTTFVRSQPQSACEVLEYVHRCLHPCCTERKIAHTNRNASKLMLVADGPSVSISIMKFRAHLQKLTNSSQRQAKLNNAMAPRVLKGQCDSKYTSRLTVYSLKSVGYNCQILMQTDRNERWDTVSGLQA